MIPWLGPRRRLQSDPPSSPNEVVAVIVSVNDPGALAIDPKTGKVLLSGEIDTSTCIKLAANTTDPLSDGVSPLSPTGSEPYPGASPAAAPASDYKQIMSTKPNVDLGPGGDPPYILIRSLLEARLLAEQQIASRPAAVPLSLDTLMHAIRSIETPEATVDVSLCGNSTTVYVSNTNTVKVLVKVNAVASTIPQGVLDVTNGSPSPVTGGTCTQPPCPYIDGPWSVFEVCTAVVSFLSVAHCSSLYGNSLQQYRLALLSDSQELSAHTCIHPPYKLHKY